MIEMYPPYHDIRNRLGEPLWHDWHGVPRYEPYRPGMQNVYARYDCLAEVKCQACGRLFLVGACTGSPVVEVDKDGEVQMRYPKLPTPTDPGFVFWGDAPWHEEVGWAGMCPGVTMTADLVRVVEFWVYGRGTNPWERHPEYEVPFVYKTEGGDENWV